MSGTQGRGGRKQAARPEREKTAGTGRKPAAAKNAGAGKTAENTAEGNGAEAGKAVAEKGPRPPRVTVAAVLTAVEGLIIAALGGYELVLGIVGEPDSTRQAVFGGLTVLALAVLPLAAGHGLWRQRRWSRGPSLITQILALPVAIAMASVGGVMLPLGLALGAVAAAALVCVVSPSTAEALGVGPGRTA
ncbi:hypothetical protein [Streptomyces sp. B5E4]|uniref:hypothetical protein n=1 Tax=Streptomyces sp. B5E4 TaxID=3153568 RepID=UPI00325F120A